ncbi:glycosyltransferase family A protein [Erythrobacter sp. A6_0]|uniref:glycosyltransferase family A protein n=1 Tax=Erythrobacter sp. A6_0 TaxID=2821089 RepID=UPI001ADAB2F9|nr:glycosyltransferase family 2 protein [Erythrobacter sp. A6_0]
MITVSVIIPVKNRPNLLSKAVHSCFSQTHKPDEIIIVDDGSTDTTEEIIALLKTESDSVRSLHNETSVGAAKARNQGAAAATGEYLAFLDSDDVWHPTKIARQLDLALTHRESPLICSGVTYVYANRPPKVVRAKSLITRSDLEYENRVVTSTAFVHAENFAKVGGFDEFLPNCEDWDLWLRLANLGDIRGVPDTLCDFTFVAPNKLSRNVEKLTDGHKQVFARIAESVTPDRERDVKANHALTQASNEILIGQNYLAGFRSIANALRLRISFSILKRTARLFVLTLLQVSHLRKE